MNLQTETDVQCVFDDPIGDFARVDETMRGIAAAGSVLAKGRREDHGADFFVEPMMASEVAGKLVVFAARNNKLNFVVRRKGMEVF